MNEWVALLVVCAMGYLAQAMRLTRACLHAIGSRASRGVQPSVSVIVCIKDDAEHWPVWWAAMKGQRWPAGTEVIAVDDGSTDELPSLLEQAEQDEVPFAFSHHRLDRTSPGKRDALRFGVGQATGEWLLFTDVDCLPAGPAWAAEMTAGHSKDVAAVLGVSWPQDEPSATWLSRLQSLDALYIMRLSLIHI